MACGEKCFAAVAFGQGHRSGRTPEFAIHGRWWTLQPNSVSPEFSAGVNWTRLIRGLASEPPNACATAKGDHHLSGFPRLPFR